MPRTHSAPASSTPRSPAVLRCALASGLLLLAHCAIWPSFPDELVRGDGSFDGSRDGGGPFDGGNADARDGATDAVAQDSGAFQTCPAPSTSTFPLTTFAPAGRAPVARDLAFDGHGALFAASAVGLVVFDSTGAVTSMVTGSDVTTAVAVRPWTSPGELVVATLGSAFPPVAGVAVVDASSGSAVSPVLRGFMAPGGVAVRGDGMVFISDTAGGTITRVTPSGAASVATTAVLAPTGLALTPDGRRLFAGTSMGSGIYVLDIDAAGRVLGDPHLYVSTLLTGEGLAFDVCGYLYASDRTMGRVLRVPPGGGSFDTIASAPMGTMFRPTGIAFGAGAPFSTTDLFVADALGSIFVLHIGVDGAPLPHG
jgi:sugar lactone lactonase YvrE